MNESSPVCRHVLHGLPDLALPSYCSCVSKERQRFSNRNQGMRREESRVQRICISRESHHAGPVAPEGCTQTESACVTGEARAQLDGILTDT